MSNDRKDKPVHIRNAHSLLQGIERIEGQLGALNDRMQAMDNRMLALERKVAVNKTLMESGVFRASSGSTVTPDAD